MSWVKDAFRAMREPDPAPVRGELGEMIQCPEDGVEFMRAVGFRATGTTSLYCSAECAQRAADAWVW